MRFQVRHLARYRYDAPVALGPHVLRLTPRGVREMTHAIQVRPEPAFRLEETDTNGNRVTRLGFDRAANLLEIELRFDLDSRNLAPPPGEAARAARYLQACEADAGLAGLAERLRRLAGADPAAFADSLAANLQGAIAFDRNDAARLRSPGETLARGRGSARDIAALFIDLSRRAGLPARFVSGYWAQSTVPSSDRGAHTWCEVLLPGAGWRGFDPTLGSATGAGHVAMAAAPDLAGTLPFSGSTFGAGIRVTTGFELTVLTPG